MWKGSDEMRDTSLYGSDVGSGHAHENLHAAWGGFARSAIPGLLMLSLLCGCQPRQASRSKAGPVPPPAPSGEAELDVAKLIATTVLPNLDGATKSLDAYSGEKGLLVVFVDTDCPFAGAAIGEMPIIAKTLAKLKISSVLVNIGDPADVVAESYQTRKTGTPVIYDISEGTQLKWNIESVPTVVLVTTDDAIVYNGPAVWADLASAATKMLSLPDGAIKFPVKGTAYG